MVGEKGEEFVGDVLSNECNHYSKFDALRACIVRPGQFCYSEPSLELRDQKSEVRGQKSEDQRTDDRRQNFGLRIPDCDVR